eukprot:TRINITY_DN8777_c3_g1_i1.p1 TRINITY_DN8777_c3_g1~~TRINITY_DN8777_c3_g1_i1.p1  ORF type:complete len:1606 (+),score=299.72 TRINITY_DN8777_c3_g1_i1:181-4998(+)
MGCAASSGTAKTQPQSEDKHKSQKKGEERTGEKEKKEVKQEVQKSSNPSGTGSGKERRKKSSKDKYKKKSKGRFQPDAQGNQTDVDKKVKVKGGERRKAFLKKLQQPSPFADALTPYVPWPVLKHFQVDSSPISTPEFSSFQGVVMMVDISGFTALSESLSKLPNMLGVELLASYINGYFTQLIDVVTEYGGAVEKFAGDALIVLFGSQYCSSSLATLTVQALSCAMQIRHRFPSYVARVSKDAPGEMDREIGVHIGIGASEVKTMTVGGSGDFWRRVVFGRVFDQLAVTMPLSQEGQIVISKEAMECVEKTGTTNIYSGQMIGEKDKEGYLMAMKPSATIPAGTPLAPIILTTAMDRGVKGFIDSFVQAKLEEGQHSISETRVLSMLFMGVNNWEQLSENITGTADTAFSSIHQMIRSIQNIVYTAEGCIANCLVDEKGCSIIVTYGIPQHTDDSSRAIKSALEIRERCEQLGIGISIGVTTGETFVGSIGSLTRRDYTIMGSAVNLGARLMTMCEGVHNEEVVNNRRESNSSTPEKGSSNVWSKILVDPATFNLTKKNTLYDTSLEQRSVRGSDSPIQLYVPMKLFKGRRDFAAYQRAQGEDGEESEGDDEERTLVMIGRAQELKLLEEVRDDVVSDAAGTVKTRVVLVYGEGGMGKSYLTRHCAIPVEKGIVPGTVLESTADTASDTAFHVWEPIFTQLLLGNMQPGVSKAKHLRAHLEILARMDDWMEFGYLQLELECFLALLNPILKTTFREPPSLSDISTSIKAKTTTSMLHIILKYHSQQQPLFILLDSMQNCHDIPSLELLLQLAESKDKQSQIMVVCTQRPLETNAELTYKQEASIWIKLREYTQSTTIITLKPLTEAQSSELLITLLNRQLQSHPDIPEITQLEPAVSSYVYQNSRSGRVYLLVGLSNAIRDILVSKNGTAQSKLGLTNGKLHFMGNDEGLNLLVPKSMINYVRSTIDRLQATQQLVVKCSSVVGMKFTLNSLHEIFPVSKSKNVILHAVLKLVEQRIFLDQQVDHAQGSENTYRFADKVVQEEAYGMVLHEQKITMHKQLADWIEGKLIIANSESDEAQDTQDQNGTMAQLARHWSAYVKSAEEQCTPEDLDRAIWCLRKHGKWLHTCGDYLSSASSYSTAHEFIPLRNRKCDDATETAELEMAILSELLQPVYKARARYTPEYCLRLHEQVLAVKLESFTDSTWETTYRATCGKCTELANQDRIAEALMSLKSLDAMTAEAGGEIEAVLGSCTTVQVYQCCGDRNSDMIEIIKDTLERCKSLDNAQFSSQKLSTFFCGMSSGMPQPDLLVALKIAYIVMGNYSQAEDVEDAAKTYAGNKTKGVSQPRVNALACQYHVLLKNFSAVTRYAENALDMARQIGDSLSVTLANFFIAIAKGSPDQAMDPLRTLTKAFGSLQLLRCALLEAVVDSGCSPMPYIDYLKGSVSDMQFAPELMRLQAILMIKVLKEDRDAAASLVEPGVEPLEARVYTTAESKLIASFNLAKQRKCRHFQMKALGALYKLWLTTEILDQTPQARTVLSELNRLMEKAGELASRFVDPEVLDSVDSVEHKPVLASRLDITARTCEAWGSLLRGSSTKGDCDE